MIEPEQLIFEFERGDYVFARCKGELPWPGKITVVYNDGYLVEFIGHKSTAVLQFNALVLFTEETTNKVLEEYTRLSEKDLGKVKRAIKLCKTEHDKAARRRECSRKKAKTPAKGKKNGEKVNSLADIPSNKSSTPKESGCLPSKDEQTEDSAQSLLQKYKVQTSQVPKAIPEEKISWSQIMAMIEENQRYEQQCMGSEAYLNTFVPEKTETIPLEIVVPIIEQAPQVNDFSMEVNFKHSVECTMDIEDDSWTAIDRMCMIFRKMIDYLCEGRQDSLTKEEQLQLYALLRDHRKIRYQPVLLQLMIGFVHGFQSANDRRESLFIEYIRVKERVQTCYLLRQQVNFDPILQQIIDSYTRKDIFMQ